MAQLVGLWQGKAAAAVLPAALLTSMGQQGRPRIM